MTNYSIDASVYAFPFHENTDDAKAIESYCKTIFYLSRLVGSKISDSSMRPRNVRYFLFENDIRLIKKYKDLLFSQEDINPLKESLNKNEINYLDVTDVRGKFQEIIDRLGPIAFMDYNEEIKEYIIFEKWFGIESINYENKSQKPVLPEYILKKITNKELRKNIRRHLALIAALNRYVYKNSKTHKLLLSNNIKTESENIPVSSDFNIKTSSDRLGNHVRIRNLPNKIEVENQNVKIGTLDTLMENSFQNYTEDEILEKINKYEYLIPGPEVKNSIIEYCDRINKEIYRLSKNKKDENKKDENKKNEVEKWKSEFPDTLFANLEALNNFAAALQNAPQFKKNNGERYYCCIDKCEDKECFEDRSNGIPCKGKCEFLDFCGSNIRCFGADCVDERLHHKSNLSVIKDRTREDSQGNRSLFWLHIRINSKKCDDPLWFLNLRIHFRPIDDFKKIEIGWIGRHLYIPCQKFNQTTNTIEDCDRETDCPLNPKCKDHDPNVDELTNFYKRYPRTP